MAQLDLVVRIGRLELLPVDDRIVEDVKNMLALVRPDDFRAKRMCVLNPTFGEASELVGGADADVLVDETLIDIKVNKKLELGRDIFKQIFGYYCLSCIGGVDGCKGDAKVTEIAIYFARFGLLHRMPTRSFLDGHHLPEMLDWIRRTAKRCGA